MTRILVNGGKYYMLKMPKPEALMTYQSQNKKKPTSEKKIAANKLNGKKSHGPLDTSKTKTNATKHGLRAAGLSILDSVADYNELLQQLMEEQKPSGLIETTLVKSVAEELIKLQRSRGMESDYINQSIYYPEPPPLYEGVVKPRLRPEREITERLLLHQRYESSFFTKMLKMLHELERLQRRRLGEAVPAPSAMDVNLHIDTNKEKPGIVPLVVEQAFPKVKTDGLQ